MSSNKIKELKFSGTEITKSIIEPKIYFSDDTTHELFESDKKNKILSYPNIIIECSFVFSRRFVTCD